MARSTFLLKLPHGERFATSAGFHVVSSMFQGPVQDITGPGDIPNTIWSFHVIGDGIFTSKEDEERVSSLVICGEVIDCQLVFDTGHRLTAKAKLSNLKPIGTVHGEHCYSLEISSVGDIIVGIPDEIRLRDN